MREENIEFLAQLVGALQKAEPKLEEAFKSQSPEYFSKVKKFVLEIQKKINEAIE